MSTRVLLLESEQLVADMIRVNLEKAGYELDRVSDGTEAIARVEKITFDMILLGVDLGGDDGLDVMRQIGEQSVDVPIMVLTSGGDVHKRVRTLEMGADDYLPKPFEMTEFMARINALLKRHGNT